jgi:hypothetical protein
MAEDISTVYTSPDSVDGCVLRCTRCPEWEVDVDGTLLPQVIRRAEEHVRDDHAASPTTPEN